MKENDSLSPREVDNELNLPSGTSFEMSGRVRMVKWTRELTKNYKPPTPKQLERLKIREQKIMKELYESDFHEITWDKKCV